MSWLDVAAVRMKYLSLYVIFYICQILREKITAYSIENRTHDVCDVNEVHVSLFA